jgi:hypothetical protein
MPADGESRPTGSGWIVPPLASIGLIAMPLLGALCVIVAVLWVVLPRIVSSLEPTPYGMKPAAYDELSAANGEHLAILRIAQTCLEGKNPALLASHPFARLLPRRPPPATVADQDPLPPRLSGYFDAYLHLSADIANARAQLADEAVTGYLVMQLFQWTIVATGMFTTILISVKGFANPQSRAYLPMAITAIVLSALGTSVATLNSFYTPRIAYEQNQRSLASRRVLHTSLTAAVVRQNHPCTEGKWSGWRARQLRGFTIDYTTIISTLSRAPADGDDADGEDGSSNMGTQREKSLGSSTQSATLSDTREPKRDRQ